MDLPPAWKIMNMQRSLAAGNGDRRLNEPDSAQVLGWLHQALTELERRGSAR